MAAGRRVVHACYLTHWPSPCSPLLQTYYAHLLCQFPTDDDTTVELDITEEVLAAKNEKVRGPSSIKAVVVVAVVVMVVVVHCPRPFPPPHPWCAVG